MTTVLYRLSSLEVLKISPADQPFSDADASFFGVLTDPSTPDGTETIDPNGDLRVLGYAKFADIGTNTARNATQTEIDTFAAAEIADESAMDTIRAQSLADIDPIFRKIFKALLLRIINEVFANTNTKVNTVIDQWEQFKIDVAASGNLADIKTSVASMSTIISDLKENVTLQQAVNALKNDVLNSDA